MYVYVPMYVPNNILSKLMKQKLILLEKLIGIQNKQTILQSQLAAKEFLKPLDKLNLEENYLAEQIFNMHKMFLFWKIMPERTFIHKDVKSMSGFKAFKGKVTIWNLSNKIN